MPKSHDFAWIRSIAIGVAIGLCPLASCASGATDADAVSDLSEELKGGVPNGNGKGKGRVKGDEGAAGGLATDDAGVTETPGKGNGKGKGQVKDKTKKEKTHGKNAAAGSGSEEEEAEDVDESTEEAA